MENLEMITTVLKCFEEIIEAQRAFSHLLFHYNRLILDIIHDEIIHENINLSQQFPNGWVGLMHEYSQFNDRFFELESQVNSTPDIPSNQELLAEQLMAIARNEQELCNAQRHYLESRGVIYNETSITRYAIMDFQLARVNESLEKYRLNIHNGFNLRVTRAHYENGMINTNFNSR